MKSQRLVRDALTNCAAAAMLTGCGGSQPPIGAPGAMPPTIPTQLQPRQDAHKYRVLFDFGSNVHGLYGAVPVAALINVNGTLYGTTARGGSYGYGSRIGGGTAFSVTRAGINERVLYSFKSVSPSGSDGPAAPLIRVNDSLYGTTAGGGKYNGGTVFSISTSGKNERTLHSFGNTLDSDGAQPLAGLIAVDGKLYGTTYQGGVYGVGTVFSVRIANDNERVIHSFSNRPDGAYPVAGLLDVSGALYGTTEYGGLNGGGAVFSIRNGHEAVLYSFVNRPDGNSPVASLITLNGTLYGTTLQGGSDSINGGTVFSVSTAGTNERVLHSFGGGMDGSKPQASLAALKGALYGTTSAGGTGSYGTVFRVSLNGSERVLHSFTYGENDGLNPVAGLINVKGTLYGTTELGGISLPSCEESGICDYGTVFALTP
jgi:uncharacterized repeat protein (TIGR03803 family)